ncbi:MAG: RNA methyltransferase [Paramuribaculum sp.]|nr:RNA methyltransferase [Paramuribaculum sp.]
MAIIRIENITDNRVAMFSSLTDAQLRNRLNPTQGIIIVESPKVINTALSAGVKPIALMCEEKHIDGDAAEIITTNPEMPVYTASRETLAQITGYTLTRGVLCAMRRPEQPSSAELCNSARRIAIIDSVVDTTNIGAIFRSAAALGIDAVMLTATSCDPLNRRAIRVSMGSVFLVPWCWIDNPASVRQYGFTTAAMALSDNSLALDAPELKCHDKLAIIMGTEGDGLSNKVIADADYVVKIPMAHGVDSLNVAAASAVAFWELRQR